MGAENPIYQAAFIAYINAQGIIIRIQANGAVQAVFYKGKPLQGSAGYGNNDAVVEAWSTDGDFDPDALQAAREQARYHLRIAREKGAEAERAQHAHIPGEHGHPPTDPDPPEVEAADPAEVVAAGGDGPVSNDYPQYEDFVDYSIDDEGMRNALAEREYQEAVENWVPPGTRTDQRVVLDENGELRTVGSNQLVSDDGIILNDDGTPLEVVELTEAENRVLANTEYETEGINPISGEIIGDESDAGAAYVAEVMVESDNATGRPASQVLSREMIADWEQATGELIGGPYLAQQDQLFLGENGSMPHGFKCVARTRSIPTYYRLGFVLEAIARNFKKSEADENIDLNFVYHRLPKAPIRIPIIGPVQDEEKIPLKIRLPPDHTGPVESGEMLAENATEWREYLSTITQWARTGKEFFKEQSARHELLYTTFDAPLIIKSVNNLLNKNPNMNALKLIKAVIALASKTLSGGQSEGVAFRIDSRVAAGNANVIEVFCTSSIDQSIEDTIENLIKTDKMHEAKNLAISITYAHNNSLVENIDVSSKIDVNAWAVFRQDGATNRMGIDLLSRLTDDDGRFLSGVIPDYIQAIIDAPWAENNRASNYGHRDYGSAAQSKDRLTNETWNTLIRKEELQLSTKTAAQLDVIRRIAGVLRELQQEGGNTDENKRLANAALGTLLFTDTFFYNRLLVDFMKDNSNAHLGKVLSNYLLTVTTTVHGIAGLSPLDYILVDNVIQGVRGIYYISNLEEDLRPGNFNTLITMQLARQL